MSVFVKFGHDAGLPGPIAVQVPVVDFALFPQPDLVADQAGEPSPPVLVDVPVVDFALGPEFIVADQVGAPPPPQQVEVPVVNFDLLAKNDLSIDQITNPPVFVAVPVVEFCAGAQFITADQVGGGPGGPGDPGTSVPPLYYGDFQKYVNDANLHAAAGTTTTGNVHAEPGVGMRYDFTPQPTRCNDQSLASVRNLPTGTQEISLKTNIIQLLIIKFLP